MKKITLILSLILISSFSFAQNNIDFIKSNFPNNKEGFEKAMQQLHKGDKAYFQGPHRYERALRYYLMANSFNPNNSHLNKLIGDIYITLNLPGEALPYIQKSVELNPTLKENAYKVLAQTYHLDMKWDDAIENYNLFIEQASKKKNSAKKQDEIARLDKEIQYARLAIQQCNNGRVLTKDSVKIIVSNLGPNINTKYPDYSAIVTPDDSTIYFTSRRSTVTGGQIPSGEPYYYEDIFFSKRMSDGQWDGAQILPGAINTKEHEGLVSLSPDGKKLIVYRSKNGGDLYESTFNGSVWSEAKAIDEINTPYRESHAAYSPDGNTLYYVSENPNLGAQNRDIFFVTKQENGKWGSPTRLNENINTPYNEDAIFIDENGTMYFASEGHNSMGGYDIFKSEGARESWTKAENLGYPVNTPADEVFFIVLGDGKKAYFNSNRRGGRGEKDIYQMLFIDNLPLLLKGKFYDVATKKQIPEAQIELTRMPSGDKVDSQTDKGMYTASVQSSHNYKAFVKAVGYEDLEMDFKIENINIDSLSARKDFYLTPGGEVVWKGKLLDGDGQTPIAGKITLSEIMTKETRSFTVNEEGNFSIPLTRGQAYSVLSESKGFISNDDMLSTNESLIEYGVINKDIALFKQVSSGVFTMKGKVFDSRSNLSVPASISIYKENKDKLADLKAETETGYVTKLNSNEVYFVKVEAEGYNILEERVKINVAQGASEFVKDFYVSRSDGKLMAIKNIYFDFDSYALKSESVQELESLKQLMTRFPETQVELSGHTDILGTYEYNKVLSLNRARAAYDWLIHAGIKANRIKYTYYSFSKPAYANKNVDGSDNAEGRALNRRVEFKLVDPTAPTDTEEDEEE